MEYSWNIMFFFFFVIIVILKDLIENFHIMYGLNYKFLNYKNQIEN